MKRAVRGARIFPDRRATQIRFICRLRGDHACDQRLSREAEALVMEKVSELGRLLEELHPHIEWWATVFEGNLILQSEGSAE